jgi:hypothetical protein
MGYAWPKKLMDKVFVGGVPKLQWYFSRFPQEFKTGINNGRRYYYSDRLPESEDAELRPFVFIAGLAAVKAKFNKE